MGEFLRTFYREWEGKDGDLDALAAESSMLLDAFPNRTIQVGDNVRTAT